MVVWREPRPEPHPHHDEVHATIAGWYRGLSAQFTVELRELGWCRRPDSGLANVTLLELPAHRLEAAIADAAVWLGVDDFRLVIDDRDLDAQFRSQLESLGWERHDVNVYLCHVGMPPPDRDATLRRVGPDDCKMAEWVPGAAAWAQRSWREPSRMQSGRGS